MSNQHRSQIMPDFTENLRPQEKILWSGKPVRAAFFLPALGGVPFALLFWVVAVAFEYMGMPILTGPSFFVIPISGLTVLLIVVIPGLQLLRFRNSKYLITNQRVIIRSGAIGKNTRFVDLDKIQEPHVKVGLVDKWFGTGSIMVLTAGQVAMSPMGGDFIDWRGDSSDTIPFHFRIISNISAVREPYDVNKLLADAVKKASDAQMP